MAQARNIVLNGYGKGMYVIPLKNGKLGISPKYGNATAVIDSDHIASYELITEEKVSDTTSAIVRAGIASWLLGPVGLLAGISGKEHGVYIVALFFKDGDKSLIEIDEKTYEKLITLLF